MNRPRNGYIRNHGVELGFFYRISDVLVILGCLSVTASIRQLEFNALYQLLGFAMAAIFTVVAESAGLYRSWRTSPGLQQTRVMILVWGVSVFSLFLLGYFLKVSASYSRFVVGLWLVVTPASLIIWRIALREGLAALRSMGFNTRSAVIIGVTENGIRLKDQLLNHKELGIRFIGFFDDRDANRLHDDFAVTINGHVQEAIELAKQGEIDHVYVAMPMDAKSRIVEYLAEFSDTTATTFLVPDFFIYNLLHARWHSLGTVQTLSVFDTPFRGGVGFVKRLQDIILATLILALISPVLVAVAIGVKLSSPGPVIFKQYRYGLDGRKIKVFKFRSMTTQDNGDVVRQATRGDARITPFGAFIRRTSLDELPQFFNVLLGSMSVVGPRPHAVAHNEQYRAIVDRYMLRHKVKPGITGLAQINGFRGETDTLDKMEKRVQYDLEYIQSWSLWLDIKIVLKTIIKGFMGKEVY